MTNIVAVRCTCFQARTKLIEQTQKNKSLQEDMRLMYKKHKKDVEQLRKEFQADEFEQRYAELLEERQHVEQLLDFCEQVVAKTSGIDMLSTDISSSLTIAHKAIAEKLVSAPDACALQSQLEVSIFFNSETSS
jgi:beta-phosphoglucomutase-like phosphatase (HAD superfamily)